MKHTLLIFSLVLAQATEARRGGSDNVKYPGGDYFNECQNLAKEEWSKYISPNSSLRVKEPSEKWDDGKIKKLFKKTLEEVAEDGDEVYTLDNLNEIKQRVIDNNQPIISADTRITETVRNNILEALKLTYEHVRGCELYMATTYNGYVDLKESISTNETKMSPDGAIKCSAKGYETQDYPACARLVTTYVASVYGKQATTAVQQLVAMDQSMDAQQNLMKNGAEDMTLGLKTQKDGIESQSTMAMQRGALDAGFAATMGKFISEMPTADNLNEDCQNSGQYESMKKLHAYIVKMGQKVVDGQASYKPVMENTKLKGNKVEGEDSFFWIEHATLGSKNADTFSQEAFNKSCTNFVTSSGQYLLQNSVQGLDAAKQKMADLGMNALMEAGKAALLNKQASDIDDAIKKVDAFEPVDWTPPSGELTAAACEADPTKEGCLAPTFGRTSSYVDPGLTISGLGVGGVVNDGVDVDTLATADPDAMANNSAKSDFKIGSTTASVDKSNGFESSAPGAATVKSGGANPSAGGGGGGGTGGIGAPAAARVAGEKEKSPFVGKAAKVQYSGDSKGSLAYGGGRGSSAKKGSGSDNPFDKLFGKKDDKNGNDVLNYRDLASSGIGGKKGSIFSRISTRYGQVQSKGRLLEYEEVK